MREEILLMGKSNPLVGIVSLPEAAPGRQEASPPALLLLNSGILHRVGPNRLHVKLARTLAREGFLVLRFDLSGIGDSMAREGGGSLQARWTVEVEEAMDALEERYAVNRFGLAGICLGATLSFKAACQDPRVVGAALINPQDHLHDGVSDLQNSEIRASATARHNWRIAFSSSMSGQKWRKALRGEVDFRSVAKLLWAQLMSVSKRSGGSPRTAEVEAKFIDLRDRRVKVLHIYSEGDVGLDYLHLMLGKGLDRHRASGALDVEVVPGSNHTFSLLDNQQDLAKCLGSWARDLVVAEASS